MTASAIREYPLFCGDDIVVTYNEIRLEEPHHSPKSAWEWAEHLHRNHPRNLAKVREIDALIPYQSDDIYV
jgi:hypothetical protein